MAPQEIGTARLNIKPEGVDLRGMEQRDPFAPAQSGVDVIREDIRAHMNEPGAARRHLATLQEQTRETEANINRLSTIINDLTEIQKAQGTA